MQAASPPLNPFFDDDPCVSYNRVWFNVMRAHRKFHPIIAKTLRNEGLKDPIWFEIILAVDRAGEEGQPMQQLEEHLFVPQYALSRHIQRLEESGFLRREFISDGKRKQILFLTDQGAGVHERIWPIYHDAMQAAIGPLMTTDDAYDLSRHLIKLLAD